MTAKNPLHVFHAPQSRSSSTIVLLNEIGAPFDLHLINMKAGEQRQPGYLAVNPLGKVPAIRHGGALVTEQVAVFLYLADLFPEAGLAPAIGDPLRGPYLRWMAFYGSSYEPALIDKAMKREPGAPAMSVYGDFDMMLNAVISQIAKGAYLLGDRFTAADVLWGAGLSWGTMFGIVPENPTVAAYVARITGRPAFSKVQALDAEWAAEHEAALEPA